MTLPFHKFPIAVASALRNTLKSFLTPHGVAVRHPNGFLELLVSHPGIDKHPEYENHTEGFRERAHEPGAGYVRQEGDKPQEDPVKTAETPVQEDPAPAQAEEVKPKAKPGPKPKATPAPTEAPTEAPTKAPTEAPAPAADQEQK